MASGKRHFVSHNMTASARDVINQVRKAQHPEFRGIDEVKCLMVDDMEVPLDVYPTHISEVSYNCISKTFNDIYGDTAVDLLINVRFKVNWRFEKVPVETFNYWMGIINSKIFTKKHRDFKVNLYFPGTGFIESVWNPGAPITGSGLEGSGLDGISGHPGGSYYTSDDLLTGGDASGRYYGSSASDANVTDKTSGVVDYVTLEIHWIERRGVRLNKVIDINVDDVITPVE